MPSLSEQAFAAIGFVLLLAALAAAIARPRSSRWSTGAGLVAGAVLIGIAIGPALERLRQPAPLSSPAASPSAAPARPALHVETRLTLHFPGNDEPPTAAAQQNVFDWYAVNNAIKYQPPAGERLGKPQEQMLKLLTEVSWSWLIYIAFDQPTADRRLHLHFVGGELPIYQIPRLTARYAVIHIEGHIPAGDLEISAGD
jgi:hypothetical protein